MKKILISAAVAAVSVSSAAMAADASPFKAGDVLVHVRGLDVMPDEHGHVSNGTSVNINHSITPEVDASYFFTPNISAELIAAVTKHDVSTSGGTDAGHAWLLPPTLTAKYHFTQCGKVIPYVGAGVNYTHFFDTKGGALHTVSYDDSFGGALQAGADVSMGGNWYANVDVKKVYIHTKATFAPSGTTAKVDIDPWIAGVGIGYKF